MKDGFFDIFIEFDQKDYKDSQQATLMNKDKIFHRIHVLSEV